jgi:hypothetical protein
MSKVQTTSSVAVFYLARGSDSSPLQRLRRFAESYTRFPAAAEHTLFVIFKGFADNDALAAAKDVFSRIPYDAIMTDDENFDFGAYRSAAEQVTHDLTCFMNSNTEILSAGWLAKLLTNFDSSSVGVVGASGSFESRNLIDPRFPQFPNVHLRSNAFVIRREHAINILPRRVASKNDAFLLESGPASITRRLWEIGLSTLVVGRNGRAFAPQWWPGSETFRVKGQDNLLVHDNVTREFEYANRSRRLEASAATWGRYLDRSKFFLLSR